MKLLLILILLVAACGQPSQTTGGPCTNPPILCPTGLMITYQNSTATWLINEGAGIGIVTIKGECLSANVAGTIGNTPLPDSCGRTQ